MTLRKIKSNIRYWQSRQSQFGDIKYINESSQREIDFWQDVLKRKLTEIKGNTDGGNNEY